MYKLVVSDMDGTLLSSEKKVSNKNQQALKALLKKDIHVAIATGRIYTSARVYAKELGIVTPIIACNGAMIRNLENDEILYESALPKKDALKTIELCKKNHVYFHYYSADTFYTEELAYSSLKYSEWNKAIKEEARINLEVIENAYDHVKNSDEKIYKILIISEDNALLKSMREELEQIPSIEVSRSWSNNIEVMNKGVSKGNAIKQLAQSLNIKKEEIMTFGDNENDISMLSYAGFGIAMGNAENYVKQKADYITSTNDEDGVAQALQKFIFKNV